jgi:hypothetical protein
MADFNRDEAEIGFGKTIEYSDNGTSGWVKVPGTVEANFPESELEMVEVTNDDSPDRHKDYVVGLYEPGTVSFTYRYGRTAFAALDAVYKLATTAEGRVNATKHWRISLADGSACTFRGVLTSHNLPTDIEDVLTVEAEIQVVGQATFTAGEAPQEG